MYSSKIRAIAGESVGSKSIRQTFGIEKKVKVKPTKSKPKPEPEPTQDVPVSAAVAQPSVVEQPAAQVHAQAKKQPPVMSNKKPTMGDIALSFD